MNTTGRRRTPAKLAVAARRGALTEPRDGDAPLLADPESEGCADGDRKHRRKMADHRDQAQLGVGHVNVSVAAPRRPILPAHVLREDPPRLDAARDVHAHVAMQRRADVLCAQCGPDANGGRFVPTSRVERPGDLPLLVEDVPAFLDPARQQHLAVDTEQVLAVETRFADLAEGADGLCFAGDRHRAETLTIAVEG
jgi:hypothetical protein